MEFLAKINDPVLLALASTCFTWFMTALGAGMVFFFKEINKRVLNMMLGFAAGIMVAASFWSLLEPAIEMAQSAPQSAPIPAWLVAAIGFVGGAGFLCLADHVMPHAHFFAKEGQTEGIPTHLKRSILLVFSITLHNIPEGLAVGVAFGAAAARAGKRRGRTNGRRTWRVGCCRNDARFAVCTGICGRGNALCGGRGTDTRGTKRRRA